MPHVWTLVDTLDKIPNLSSEKSIVVDIESTSFDPDVPAFNPFKGHRIAGLGISTVAGPMETVHSWYFPLRHRPTEQNLPFEQGMKALRALMNERPDRVFIGHNIKFDMRFLSFDDLVPKEGQFLDTIVLARLCRNYIQDMRLGSLSKMFLSHTDDFEAKKSDSVKEWCTAHKTKDYGAVPAALLGEYCCQDCRLTANIAVMLNSELPECSRTVYNTEKELTRVLLNSELRGALLDVNGLRMEHLQNQFTMMQETIAVQKYCGKELNLNSTKDVGWLLFDKIGVKPIKWTEGGEPSLDAPTLLTYAGENPIARHVVKFREAAHFIGNYCEGWVNRAGEDSVLHGTFNQAGTQTGRCSSSDPNMQNIQVKAKRYIMPRPGRCFLSCDYAQIEYRVFGHYANDPVITTAYAQDADTDFHQKCADLIGVPDRQFAKSLNFAFIYGMGKKKLLALIAGLVRVSGNQEVLMRIFNMQSMSDLGSQGGTDLGGYTMQAVKDLLEQSSIDDVSAKAAEELYDKYHATFPSINEFTQSVWRVVKSRGFLRNLYGRVYRVSDAPHKSVNYLVQGSSADMFKHCMVNLYKSGTMAKYDAHLLLNVHDEAVIEVPIECVGEAAMDIQKVLQDPGVPIRIPILADVGVCSKRWADKVETSFRVEKPYQMPTNPAGVREALRRSEEKWARETKNLRWEKKNYDAEGKYVEPVAKTEAK